MDTQITFANIDDTPFILEFIRALAKFEKLESEMVATEESLRTTLFGVKPGAEVIFISEGLTKVGFALFFPNYSTFLAQPGIYLEDLFIQPNYRGKGYGKKLLAFLADLAIRRGCGRLEWSVLNWNKPAITLYLSLGSKPMDEWTVHRLTGESLMKLAQTL
jgi:GNAT superfamily N-acetyltransferase